MLQFGGPDSLDAVEPFLYNLFSDPDIVQIPLGFIFQKPLAKLISTTRSKSVRLKYAEIGGKSPIVEQTAKQQRALQASLDRRFGKDEIYVGLAMRYWRPFTEETVLELMRRNITDVVLLPLYAQYSVTNAASSFNEWDRVTKRLGVHFEERRIDQYYDNESYLAALNERIDVGLQRFPDPENVHILFSAHGTPVDLVTKGDPYSAQIAETMELVMARRTKKNPYSLSFQSKVGPKKWLTPATDKTIIEFGSKGIRQILVVPIAFVSDHIETVHELNIEVREIAEHAGITQFEVCEGLNDAPLFIQALTELSVEALDSL